MSEALRRWERRRALRESPPLRKKSDKGPVEREGVTRAFRAVEGVGVLPGRSDRYVARVTPFTSPRDGKREPFDARVSEEEGGGEGNSEEGGREAEELGREAGGIGGSRGEGEEGRGGEGGGGGDEPRTPG